MCGILGIVNANYTNKSFELLLNKLSYRGPNETIIAKFNKLRTIIGMKRLSIQDVRSGLYPFTYKNLSLIYNGEIYNFNELRKLIPKYTFNTTCDGEIILPLYDKFGPKAFDLLRGMFAITIVDQKNHQIILARDKFGEKPLYYYNNRKLFFFASEIGSFPQKYKSIRSEAIPEFLTFGFIPDKHTFFKNIFKLKMGEYGVFDITKNTFHSFMYASSITKSADLSIDSLDRTLNQIIKEKMVSDVPLGIFLSGGVDSSLIAALAQSNSPKPIHTFSIGFKDKNVDESHYAKIVAKYLKTKHIHITLKASDISKYWHQIIDTLDEPISDPALFPTYILAKKASKYVKVILSGEGADEIFGGYSQYLRESQLQHFSFIKNLITQFLASHQSSQKYWRLFSPITSHYTQTIYQSLWSAGTHSRQLYLNLIKANWHEFITSHKINPSIIPLSIQQHDLNYYLPEQLCMKVDKMTMRHSIESRAPFLDSQLLPFMPISTNKYLLRKVAQNYLPHEIAWRPKHGFSLPLSSWINSSLKSKLNELQHSHPLLLQYLDQSSVNAIVDQFEIQGNNELTIWNLITLNSWLNHYSTQSKN